MKSFPRLALPALLLLCTGSSAHAQFIRGGFQQRQGVHFHVRTGPFSSFSYSAASFGFGYAAVPAYGFYGPVPLWNYGWPGIPIVNTPVQVQPPIIINNIVQAPAAPAPVPRNAAPPVELAPVAMAPAPPPAPAARQPVAMALPRAVEPARPMLGQPDADRAAESGRKAFAEGQHGRALEFFQRAARITPQEPSVYFLIAQSQFALGKYREALQAVENGMAVRIDWSDARFPTRDLYWKKPALFDEHLDALRQAVAAFPDDAGLRFLLGHQLWFDGKLEDGRQQILLARKLGLPLAEKFGVQ